VNKTKRRFGQNFLDSEMSKKIAEDLPSSIQDEILEIGPGLGALTEWLLPICSKLTAVEIDNFCIPKLQEKFKNNKNFNLIHQNFLRFNIETWADKHPNSWLVGNLPYNMATAIITRVLPHISKIKACMFMTQAEVAERMSAVAGTKNYGSLTVFCNCYAKVRIIRFIEPKHFSPKPRINSATIMFEPLPQPLCPNENFFAFVKAAFSQKRKTLANALSAHYPKEKVANTLKNLHLNENARAEQLSLNDFILLSSSL
jgi:16S rRNA (adenine1518-N6/adenine1519-N6)-dimethyltransferase